MPNGDGSSTECRDRSTHGLPEVDFARVFDDAPVSFLLLTPDLVVVHANHAFLATTATTLGQVVGRDLFDAFPGPQDPSADGVDHLRRSLALARDTGLPQTMPLQRYDVLLPDGTWVERYWSARHVPVLDDDGAVVLLLHRCDDITDYVQDRAPGDDDDLRGARRPGLAVEADLFARTQELLALNHQLEAVNLQLHRTRDELAVRATHDSLTGLLGRASLLDLVTHALSRLSRHRGDVAVLFVDLDGLKRINDVYGHAAGDALIRWCARRLEDTVRPSDSVARIGGDEYVVVLDELDEGDGERAGQVVAQRLLDALDAPCAVAPQTRVRASASIGIATVSSRGTAVTDPGGSEAPRSAEELLSKADAAMYEAKRSGRGRFRVFDEAAHRAVTVKRQLELDLRDALPGGQLRLHYQPIIDLRDGATRAVEALLRWQHPDGRLRSAGEFIHVAEQAGLLGEIGSWVVEEVCRQIARWDATLGAQAPERVFVNVSTAELSQPRLHQHLAATARTLGIRPGRLVVEVTETGMLDATGSADTVTALQRMGCELAIDDFGTGYSSLSRLVQLPAHVLKVDRSFLRELHRDQQSVAVIAAVLTLAHNLRKTVIAEGVEDAASLAILQDLGCDYAQGYHLGRPQSADDLAVTLAGGP